MDMHGVSSQDLFRIDDLLDFSNDDLFSSSTTSSSSANTANSLPQEHAFTYCPSAPFNASLSFDFTHEFCLPTDDVAELEWLSQFVDDSFSDFPANSLAGTLTGGSDPSFPARARSKRSRAATTTATATSCTSTPESGPPATGKVKPKKEDRQLQHSAAPDEGVRRCTHCASEKTPQWRTGPLGPKTLCNACGVRYKSGRLVPEYRPAASPTFVLTQHSNSHRKVLELRRQKELLRQQQQMQLQLQKQPRQQDQIFNHHTDFEVC